MTQPLTYSASALKALKPTNLSCFKPSVPLPPEVTRVGLRRKRGKKGGLRTRLKKMKQRLPLPTVITGNARSLNNKLDEFNSCVNHVSEYKHSSLNAFSETWFKEVQTDSSCNIDGFTIVRGGRTLNSGKQRGGGVCLYLNKSWCDPNNIYKVNHLCTPYIEILTTTLRPYYLLREFPKITVNVKYVPPSADNETAATTIAEAVNQQLTQSPDSVVLITGDLNTCMPDPYIPRFHQYVDCPTRNNKTLGKCYINVYNAYKSKQLRSLGDSDHLIIELLPPYKTVMKRMLVMSKEIKLWDEDGCERLRGCLECTDWNVFYESCPDIDELNDVISD
ncbi:endonuclease domain of the non-LTR retrotransposon LINE-1 [Elysia marginata]|uniref:Endonuclease domain of the non-LTR retrotransposon LINE-1 n=1 Tax=Elysia marginata TaxID=1093978 RepID=A0AAV4F1C8_9GAST|nr:endonuclease domain of the non-LTR retrotransposon LINE-1 [Elysia marginata]